MIAIFVFYKTLPLFRELILVILFFNFRPFFEFYNFHIWILYFLLLMKKGDLSFLYILLKIYLQKIHSSKNFVFFRIRPSYRFVATGLANKKPSSSLVTWPKFTCNIIILYVMYSSLWSCCTITNIQSSQVLLCLFFLLYVPE